MRNYGQARAIRNKEGCYADKEHDMNKLTALIEASRVAEKDNGPWPFRPTIVVSTATILELCALLEKAEEALKLHDYGTRYPQAIEALAAIKQWKEKADAIRGLA